MATKKQEQLKQNVDQTLQHDVDAAIKEVNAVYKKFNIVQIAFPILVPVQGLGFVANVELRYGRPQVEKLPEA